MVVKAHVRAKFHEAAFRPLACSPLAFSPSGFFAPWLIRPLTLDDSLPPVAYTSDSLLKLVFQFTEKQQVTVSSRH